jgi:hypothetical protein
MELNAETKIDDLLSQYPFLLDFLTTLSPVFSNLKNPEMRESLGKIATLSGVSAIGGIELDTLISAIATEIEKLTDESAAFSEGSSVSSGGPIRDPEERQEELKKIIRDLHAGEDMEILKLRFKQLVHGVEALEVAKIEQSLMDEGLPPEDIKRLCDVHVELFQEALQLLAVRSETVIPPRVCTW